MLVTQEVLASVAERIERAYSLRRPGWYRGCSTPGVWATAASILIEVHRKDPAMPLDPELFVAAQLRRSDFADPWIELARPVAARRYRNRVRRIIDRLRAELGCEVQHAERRIRRGEPVDRVVLRESRSLSPLGRYLVACRAGRDDLLEQLRAGAVDQHHSCPLYRQACLILIRAEAYPVHDVPTDVRTDLLLRGIRSEVSLN